jgi:hypothetical protein
MFHGDHDTKDFIVVNLVKLNLIDLNKFEVSSLKLSSIKLGSCEITSSHGSEYDDQSCLLGYTGLYHFTRQYNPEDSSEH